MRYDTLRNGACFSLKGVNRPGAVFGVPDSPLLSASSAIHHLSQSVSFKSLNFSFALSENG